MYDVFIITVLPLVWIALNISSFIIVLLHELAHALPALIFTKKPVSIYIGIYGDNTSPRLTIGRLTIYARPKFSYLKNRGLCVYQSGLPIGRQTIILLAGPVVTFIIAAILFNYLVFSDADAYIKALIGCAFASAIINLVVNLFPKKIQVGFTKRFYYSDGYQMILLFEDKANYQNIMVAYKYDDEKDYPNALQHLQNIPVKYMDESVFSLILACYIELKQYPEAAELPRKYTNTKWYALTSATDHNNLAYAHMQLDEYEQALTELNTAVKLDPGYFYALYNHGIVQNMLGNYPLAKEDLNKALFINSASASAYSQLAFVNLKLGRPGEALTDIEKAFAIEPGNAYAYLATGIYLFDKKEFKTALDNFESAVKADVSIPFAAGYIKKTKAALKKPAKAKPQKQ